MNEGNKLRGSHQIIDFANRQQVQSNLHLEPYNLPSSTSSFSRSNINQTLFPPGNMNNFDLHRLPEHLGGPTFYGRTQYDQPTNFPNLHLNPGSRVLPVPLNHGYVDQLPSSSNYSGNLVPISEHGRSNFSTDSFRGLCKRKNPEGIPRNIQHGHSSSSTMEVRLHMESPMIHNNNYLLQGNHGGQSIQPSNCTWLDRSSINNGAALPWNGPPMLPYFQGSSVHARSSEVGNAGIPSYAGISNNHGSLNFLHSPQNLQRHHNLHPPPNIQGVRGYGIARYPHFGTAPSRVPTSDVMQLDGVRILQGSAESASRPTGIRMYRSYGRSLFPHATSRRRDLPHLRTLQADGVALLEFPDFYEVDNFIDQHRDMRLDTDDMSYEELLALSEQIGSVGTGISEQDITCHLKTRIYSSIATCINLDQELPGQTNDRCIICQDEYEDKDKLGSLDCGHEYHVDCLKKWLLVKNVCPICKSSALIVDRKDQ